MLRMVTTMVTYKLFIAKSYNGNYEYYIMGKNQDGQYVSFEHVGTNLDKYSVLKIIEYSRLEYSESYTDLEKAIENFDMIKYNYCERFSETLDQIIEARRELSFLESPFDKMLKERAERNKRIIEARKNNEIYECHNAAMKEIIEAYIESLS